MASIPPNTTLSLSKESHVLVLGTGYVAEPCIQFLNRDPLIRLTVASNEESKLSMLEKKYSCNTCLLILPAERDKLPGLVQKYDVIISLLPKFLHAIVVEVVVEQRKHMVTSSYVSEEMRKFDSLAKGRNLILLNEMGLDPGIDHMLALREIQQVHDQGGKIISYTSWAGGLPAPESADNPLKYKFTWAPIGMLTNIWNPMKYLKEGHIITGEGGTVIEHLDNIQVTKELRFEVFPNRDSLVYKDEYKIHNATTVIRGSLRYPGHMKVLNALKDLKLIDRSPLQHSHSNTWSSYLLNVLGRVQEERDKLVQIVTEILGDTGLVDVVGELGLLSDTPIEVLSSPVETLARFVEDKYPLKSDERDLVVLLNTIVAEYSEGERTRITAALIEYGIVNGFSAMSRCVGLTAAIGCKMVLLGMIAETGVITPSHPLIIQTALQVLESEGLSFKVKREDISQKLQMYS
ncbi:hypothetical protein LOD99_942 [Oopsacas minuta]|uniref:Saccharopine dehydrogenase n=1 Tax=Oopsacas minuta TaxID=111878 RepID=A0AAV7K040_9METZ|nr:hypothetical protein LOD99_942 [Oopsacas minuta]